MATHEIIYLFKYAYNENILIISDISVWSVLLSAEIIFMATNMQNIIDKLQHSNSA